MKVKLFCTLPLSLCLAWLTGCSASNNNHSEEDTKNTTKTDTHEEEDGHAEGEIIFTPEQAKAAQVVVEEIRPGDFAECITVAGSILPAQGSEATVSATMSGIVQIANNQITEGSEVKAGQGLFSISTQLLGDGNPVAASKAELAAAEKEWERAQKLRKDKIISEKEYEDIRLRYEIAQSTAKSLGNGKEKRGVTSPITGYVQNLLVRNGDYVTAGQALATITQNRKLQLRADVPERYFGVLNDIVSANFQVTYDADKLYELSQMEGRLISSGRTANKGEGFLPVTFEFDNIGNIIPGSLAEIYLLGRAKKGVISLPVTALTEEQGLFYVYVQTSDHSYLKREVHKGNNNGKRVEILSGLVAGDKVVAKGAVAVKLAANSGIVPDAHAGHNH